MVRISKSQDTRAEHPYQKQTLDEYIEIMDLYQDESFARGIELKIKDNIYCIT